MLSFYKFNKADLGITILDVQIMLINRHLCQFYELKIKLNPIREWTA